MSENKPLNRFNFNSEALYELVMIIEGARPYITPIFQKLDKAPEGMLIKDLIMQDDNLDILVSGILQSVIKSKDRMNSLIKIMSCMTDEEIKKLDGYDYVDLVNEILNSIDWVKLAGKLQTLVGGMMQKLKKPENTETTTPT